MIPLPPMPCAADRRAGRRALEVTGDERRLSRSRIDHHGWFSTGEPITMRRNRGGGARA
jgi:hypothetical protein